MGVFVAGVPSSLAPRTPFFSRVLAHLPLPRLRLLRRLLLTARPRQITSFQWHLLSEINQSEFRGRWQPQK